jgi:5-methylcytosine-specific restriction endonuclease McrA
MADYDWFSPTQKELEDAYRKRNWEKFNKVTQITTSTAIGTRFYVCSECGTVIYCDESSVTAHRKHFHPESVAGKHRREIDG